MQKIISTIDISTAIDASKAMKLDYIVWHINEYGEVYSVVGAPTTLNYIARYNNPNVLTNIMNFSILFTKDMISKFEEIMKLQVKEIYFCEDIITPVGYEEYSIGVNKYIMIPNLLYSDIIMKIIHNEYFIFTNSNFFTEFGLITDNEDIQLTLTTKAADGCTKLNIEDKYLMFISKGFIPINKGDKLYLTVYHPYVGSKDYLAKFTITKKKAVKIDFIFYCINLI